MAAVLSFIEVPPQVVLSGNRATFAVLATGIGTYSNVKVRGRIILFDEEGYPELLDISNTPDNDGMVYFDVNGLFEDPDTNQFVFPEHVTNMVIPRPDFCRNYTFTCWASYTDENGDFQDNISTLTQINQYYLPGGASEDGVATLAAVNSDWWTDYKLNKRWLNWLPGKKATVPGAIEKLFYVAEETKAETLRIDAILSGSGGETDFREVNFAAEEFTVYELSVSYDRVKELFDLQNLDSYTVSLSNGRSQSYLVDKKPYVSVIHFLWKNSFKMPETLWCKGGMVMAQKYGKELVEKRLNRSSNYLDSPQEHIRQEITHGNLVKTGDLGREEWVEWAGEILAGGPGKFIYTEDSITPIVILNNDVVTGRDPNYEPYSFEIQWDYGKRSVFRSNYKLPLEFIYPPFYNDLTHFYRKGGRNIIPDEIGNKNMALSGGNILLPELAIFDFTDTDHWSADILTDDVYVGPYEVTPAFFDGEILDKYATDLTHSMLYYCDYKNNDPRSILPVLLFPPGKTESDQEIIVAWLKWYLTVFSLDGDYFATNDGNIITLKPYLYG